MSGFSVFGDTTGTVIQNFLSAAAPLDELSLPWREIPADPQEVFKLLSWQLRITPLIGRNRELAELQTWLHTQGQNPRIRLISGPGGAGKTRLAGELAQRQRTAGWTAGFWRLDKPAVFQVSDKGLLLVLDYPEQHRPAVQTLLADLAALEQVPAPIRVLMLCRQPLAWWIDLIDAAGSGGLVDEQSVDLKRLTNHDAADLFQQTVGSLAGQYQRPDPSVTAEAARAWLARDPANHNLPLFIRAAAIHAVFEAAGTLTLGSSAIVAGLVRRERRRLRGAGEACGLGPEGLPRLVGLAALSDGLDAQRLQRLAAPELQLGVPSRDQIVDVVRRTPEWDGEFLPAPTPDIVGAELLFQVIQQRPDIAPNWLWAVVRDSGPRFIDRLGRILHDLGSLELEKERRVEEALVRMIEGSPERAMAMEFVSYDLHLPVGINSLATAVARVLVGCAKDDTRRAACLTILSIHLSNSADKPGALAAIQEAVEIWRRLSQQDPPQFEPELAGGLNNLSISLNDVGDKPRALAAILEAVGIWRNLSHHDALRFEPALGMNLYTLSSRLSESGDTPGALAAIQEGVTIRRRVSKQSPPRLDPELAGGLNILARRLGEYGDTPAALATIREAVYMWRCLSKQNSLRFDSGLANSLHTRSIYLSKSCDKAGALEAIREAVDIWRRLARLNPLQFEPELAGSLNNLSMHLNWSGDKPAALVPIREAVDILRRVACMSPLRFELELAGSLNNLSICLGERGDQLGAQAAEQEAAEIMPRRTQQN